MPTIYSEGYSAIWEMWDQEKGVRLLLRADAAFAKPEVYEYLESRDTGADLTIRPGPLVNVVVSPTSVVVEEGVFYQFLATGHDQFGNEIRDATYIWNATNGPITQDGLYTAGQESVSDDVIVEASFDGVTQIGRATVLVPPIWVPTGNMAFAQDGHHAILLADDKVLVETEVSTAYTLPVGPMTDEAENVSNPGPHPTRPQHGPRPSRTRPAGLRAGHRRTGCPCRAAPQSTRYRKGTHGVDPPSEGLGFFIGPDAEQRSSTMSF